jgi:TIR domain
MRRICRRCSTAFARLGWLRNERIAPQVRRQASPETVHLTLPPHTSTPPSRAGGSSQTFLARSVCYCLKLLSERFIASLAQLPEIVGFFSYSREDDEAFRGSLSALRDAIQRDLSAQLGRTKRNFRLWQDQEAIAPGKMWESEIAKAVEEAAFFIPIVTPRAVASKYCKFEFESFLARERTGPGRSHLPDPLHSGSRLAG